MPSLTHSHLRASSHADDEHLEVKDRSTEEVKAFRDEHGITIEGATAPNPVTTFDEAQFPEYILAEIRKAGFDAPTAIQAQGWPIALSGNDFV